MAGNCNNTNPLQLPGTSQDQRVLPALDPQSAPIDGRQTYDWILFAKEYGRYLQFYNSLNIPDGDWQALMQGDISVVLASLVAQQMPLYQDYQSGLYTQILDLEDNAANQAVAKQLLEAMFDLLFSWIQLVDQQYRLLPVGTDEQTMLGSLIQGSLAVPLYCLSNYYNKLNTWGLLAPVTSGTPIDVSAPITLTINPAETFSQPKSTVWTVSSTLIVPGIPISGGATPDALTQIRSLVTSNVFNSVAGSILAGVGTISTYAQSALTETITSYPSHTPHYALYLTFLQLFQQAITHLNGFTAQHLQFYYEQVLQLSPLPASGDQVHLVVTLQKNVPYLILPKGTAVQAGKDASGKALYYATVDNYTVNQGLVAALSSIQTVTANDGTYGTYTTVYESPIANSGDGDGAALTTPDQSWYPFGNLQKIKETAALGMAIASQDLYLKEGQRTVVVTFNTNSTISLPAPILQGAFEIQLTGAKGWITATGVVATPGAQSLKYTFTLDGNTPAVVAYSASLHGGSFNTSLPMIQFLLQIQADTYNPLYAFNAAGLTGITIATTVLGAKQLVVSTDTGPLDPSKPFMPFGATPHVGSAMTLGHKESFSKNLNNLTLLVEWDKIPAVGLDIYEDTNYPITDATGKLRHRIHQADIAYLEDGIWNEDAPRGLFTGAELFTSFLYPSTWLRNEEKYASNSAVTGSGAWQNAYDAIAFPTDQFSPCVFDSMTDQNYSTASMNGYARLTLAGDDFGYDDYLNSLLNVTITAGTDTSGNATQTISRVQPPYVPVIKSMMLSYSSSEAQDFTATGGSAFYFLYPFGYQQSTDPATLLPAYTNQGELYIGLSGLKGPQTISLLIQVSEGSGDPRQIPPTVLWSYLSSSNTWVTLDPKTKVQDATLGLLQSGLVILTLPATLGISAALMGGSNSWLRASVQNDVDAICNIITITAQGILAGFTDYAGTGVTFTASVPAGTIGKWVTGQPSVKTLSQPYDSFGGVAAETNTQFSTRVSERLRHKDRAISIWDCEHMILQEFPQLYKAKCLNHTCYIAETSTTPESLNEGLPGHVTVVTLPNIQNQHSADPYTPYTSLAVLTQIQTYLATVMSPFVQIHMANPQFEAIQFEVCVLFLEGYDPTAYSSQLSQDIAQFLSPWAFEANPEIDFGGSLAKSVVLKFIEDQPYVDYVTCIEMNQYIAGTVLYDLDVAVASTSLSILVSYYDPNGGPSHNINASITDTNTCDCT